MTLKFIEFSIYLDMYRLDPNEKNKEIIYIKYDEYIKTVLSTLRTPLDSILEGYLKLDKKDIQKEYSETSSKYFWYYHDRYAKMTRKNRDCYKQFPFKANLKKLRKYQKWDTRT